MTTTFSNKTPLGKLIIKCLYLKGKNQAWLADQIHVHPNHISIICSKAMRPRECTLRKISAALGIEMDELNRAVLETAEAHEE